MKRSWSSGSLPMPQLYSMIFRRFEEDKEVPADPVRPGKAKWAVMTFEQLHIFGKFNTSVTKVVTCAVGRYDILGEILMGSCPASR